MAIAQLDPDKKIKVVSISDPAIDHENSDLESYQENRDPKFLKFIEGEYPTYFIVNNVSSTEQVVIQHEHVKVDIPDLKPGQDLDAKSAGKLKVRQTNTGEMLIKYFRLGCKQYEENGKVYDCDPDRYPPTVIQEIASLIIARSSVQPGKKKS